MNLTLRATAGVVALVSCCLLLGTGLTWEKKSDDGSIHDKDDVFSPQFAWNVFFFLGGINFDHKGFTSNSVRAMRGGL